MRNVRFRSFFDDALFVVLIMAAAMASAALEAGAVLGAFPAADSHRIANASASIAPGSAAAASAVDGALLSAAAPRPGRLAH